MPLIELEVQAYTKLGFQNRIVTYETQLTTARENLSTYSSQVASLSASLAEIRLVVVRNVSLIWDSGLLD